MCGGKVLRSLAASRHGIGVRLLIGVLLFGGVVTLILTAIQLYVDYRRGSGANVVGNGCGTIPVT